MNKESHTDAVNQEELFARFYNEDILPNQLNDVPKEPTTTNAPDATSAAQWVGENKQATGNTEESQKTEAEATQPPSSETSPDPNDWLKNVPPEVRAHFENALKQQQYWQQKHQEQASKNRKLHNEINQLKAKVTQPVATYNRTQEEVDDDWKKLEEADPVLAKILKKREEQIANRLRQEADSKAREYVEPIHAERQEQYIAYQQDVLTQAVPNWREVVQDPYFRSWLEDSSDGVKGLYSSLDARDSFRVLQLYASDMQTRFGNMQQPSAVEQPAEAPKPTEATKLQEARQERLAKSAPISPNPAGSTKAAQLTPEQMFAKFYEDPEAILNFVQKQRAT